MSRFDIYIFEVHSKKFRGVYYYTLIGVKVIGASKSGEIMAKKKIIFSLGVKRNREREIIFREEEENQWGREVHAVDKGRGLTSFGF